MGSRALRAAADWSVKGSFLFRQVEMDCRSGLTVDLLKVSRFGSKSQRDGSSTTLERMKPRYYFRLSPSWTSDFIAYRNDSSRVKRFTTSPRLTLCLSLNASLRKTGKFFRLSCTSRKVDTESWECCSFGLEGTSWRFYMGEPFKWAKRAVWVNDYRIEWRV